MTGTSLTVELADVLDPPKPPRHEHVRSDHSTDGDLTRVTCHCGHWWWEVNCG